MNFTSVINDPFCEGQISGIPEYWNSISSLFISLVMWGGLHTKDLHQEIKTIYFILFLNGFSSMFFHWTMYYGWKMFDQFTMIFAIWFGIKRCINLVQYKDNIYLYSLHFLNIVVLVLSVCEYDNIFRTFFTIETLFLIYFHYILTVNLRIKDSYKLGRKGLIISLSAGLFWIVTELHCNKYLILGHAVWHLGISYGMHLFLQFLNSISNSNVSSSKVFTLHPKRVFGFIPILGEEYI